MITRTWHSKVRSENGAAYHELVTRRSIRDRHSDPGNRSGHVLGRAGNEVTHSPALTFCRNLDARRPLAGDEVEAAKYYPEVGEYLMQSEQGVTHYAVVGKRREGPRFSESSKFRVAMLSSAA